MEIAAVAVTLLMLLCFTLFVIAAVRTVRAVNRGMERAGTQVRKGIDETTLKVKAAQPGVIGQVARTRLELRSSIDTTRRELTAGGERDASLRESLVLLDQLHDHARVLDRELAALMDREPDRARIAARLPEVRARAAEIRQSADSLRFAAQDRARQHDADGLASLHEQIRLESGALRHWTPASEDPAATGPDPATAGPTAGDSTADSTAPGQGGAPGKPAASGGSEPSAPPRGVRKALGAKGESGGVWSDVNALWEARNQLPNLRKDIRSQFRKDRPSRDAG